MANDSDKEYLGGCLFVAIASLAVIVPPIAICLADELGNKHQVFTSDGLRAMFLMAAVISALLGLVANYLGSLAGRFGAFGGFLCGAAYWFMHLQQSIAKAPAQIGVQTEYPDSTMWIVPLAWIAIGFFVSFVPMFKNRRQRHKDS